MIDEDQVSPDDRGSQGPFVPGHYPKKVGFTANLLAAQTDQTGGTVLGYGVSALAKQLNY
jgi:hypothetical protein